MSLTIGTTVYEQLSNGSYVEPTTGATFASQGSRSKGVSRDLIKNTRRVSAEIGGVMARAYTQLNLTLNQNTAPEFASANLTAFVSQVIEMIDALTGIRPNDSGSAITNPLLARLTSIFARIQAGLPALAEGVTPTLEFQVDTIG